MAQYLSMKCYIALGGNIGNTLDRFRAALKLIGTSVGPVVTTSKVYCTSPLDPPELQDTSQPDFLNAVIECETSLSPHDTLLALLDIERLLGRDRAKELRWGPRRIDIDLLLHGNAILSDSTLTVPHPEIQNRDFVLEPLRDIAPNLVHPVLSCTVSALLASYHSTGKPIFVKSCLEEQLEGPLSHS